MMARYERLNTDAEISEHSNYRKQHHYLHSRVKNVNDKDDCGDNVNGENEEIELSNDHQGVGNDVSPPDKSVRFGNGFSSLTMQMEHQPHGKLPSSRLMHMAIGTLATILLYLSLSICLTFYQKAIIKKYNFPLTIVSYHLVIKLCLSSLVRSIYSCRTGKTRVTLDWRTSLRKMAPTGIASGIDIGFSNWGLELVPISLYTMTKSSTIVFILFFAILLGLEKKSGFLVVIVSLIAVGLFMFTYKSTQFDLLGFLFILVASLSSGVRWSFAQFVMQKTKLGLHNPVDMIYHMQPWMIASLVPFLITFESQKLYDILRDMSGISYGAINETLLGISVGAFLAFLMEVSEFLVLSKTSSLTLSIAGIFKDICQLALAVALNGDKLKFINVLGLVVCLAGICCHLVHKYSTLQRLEEIYACTEDAYGDDDEEEITISAGHNRYYHESQVNAPVASNEGGATQNESTQTATGKSSHSSQMVPLLDDNDTEDDDSQNEADAQSASDVIFDVLKRRDMYR